MDLEDIKNALAGVFYIATCDGDQPHVRPFDGAYQNGYLYIGTNNDKEVYKQILKNPKIEIFSMEKGIVRFTAEAYPVEDETENKELYENIGKNYSDTAAVLKLVNMRGTITDIMGEKSKFIINAEK